LLLNSIISQVNKVVFKILCCEFFRWCSDISILIPECFKDTVVIRQQHETTQIDFSFLIEQRIFDVFLYYKRVLCWLMNLTSWNTMRLLFTSLFLLAVVVVVSNSCIFIMIHLYVFLNLRNIPTHKDSSTSIWVLSWLNYPYVFIWFLYFCVIFTQKFFAELTEWIIFHRSLFNMESKRDTLEKQMRLFQSGIVFLKIQEEILFIRQLIVALEVIVDQHFIQTNIC